MGEVISLSDFYDKWKEIFACDGTSSTLRVYMNTSTGALEFVQMNDEGVAITTCISSIDATRFFESQCNHRAKVGNK